MLSQWAKLLLLTSCTLISLPVHADKAPAKLVTFMTLSDIHFDPFLECVDAPKPCALLNKLRNAPAQNWSDILASHASKTPAKFRDDTNYALLKSTLLEASAVSKKENPQFITILGDFLAHDFRRKYKKYSGDKSYAGFETFVKKTFQYMTIEFNQAFPTIDVYPVVGNNDSYEGDYQLKPHGQFFRDTAATWSVLIKNKANRERFMRTFPIAGYYNVMLPMQPNQRVIVLDTVLFSSHNNKSQVKQAALEQLNWLHAQLADLAKHKQRAILAYHIPIGIDVYATLKKFKFIQEFWHPIYNEKFEQELKSFPGSVNGILSGHIHMDTFQLMTISELADIPINYTPSVSPIFGNNPAFKVYSFDTDTQQITNYVTYFYPQNSDLAVKWQKEYSFNRIYQPDCTHCNLISGMRRLAASEVLASYFKKYYAVSTDVEPISAENKWTYYWCGIYTINSIKYKECLRTHAG